MHSAVHINRAPHSLTPRLAIVLGITILFLSLSHTYALAQTTNTDSNHTPMHHASCNTDTHCNPSNNAACVAHCLANTPTHRTWIGVAPNPLHPDTSAFLSHAPGTILHTRIHRVHKPPIAPRAHGVPRRALQKRE